MDPPLEDSLTRLTSSSTQAGTGLPIYSLSIAVCRLPGTDLTNVSAYWRTFCIQKKTIVRMLSAFSNGGKKRKRNCHRELLCFVC